MLDRGASDWLTFLEQRVINKWTFKPFEIVAMMKGYTNKVEFDLIEDCGHMYE